MPSLACPSASVRLPGASAHGRLGAAARKGKSEATRGRRFNNAPCRVGRSVVVKASASSEPNAVAPDEDADVNYKLFAMGFCDSGDGGSWMGADSDSSDEPPGGNRIRVGLRDSPSLGSKIAAACAE